MKIGLALGGGGVRAAAHLGVVQALIEEGIEPSIYSGASGGAIAAALLALGYSPRQALAKFEATGNMLDIAFLHIIAGMSSKEKKIQGMFKGNRLERSLSQMFEGKKISETTLPLGVVATELGRGSQVIFTNTSQFEAEKVDYGDSVLDSSGTSVLHEIVRASCSLPAVFIPKQVGAMTLVDGGLTNNLPSDIARALGAEKVISVNLSTYGAGFALGGLPSIVKQSMDVITKRNADISAAHHGVVINPRVSHINLLDFTALGQCFERGYTECSHRMGDIIKELEKNQI